MKTEKNTEKSKAFGSKMGYYELHTQAADDLVNATKENTPVYSKEELAKYTSGAGKKKLPVWLKTGLLKMWFYGAVCYFTYFGLGMFAADQTDLFFASAIIMGMATDLMLNRLLRFAARTQAGEKRYLFVDSRGMKGFFLNIVYAFFLLFLIVTFYSAVNAVRMYLGSAKIIGVEPVLFGLVAMLADSLMIFMKRTLIQMIDDAKRA